MVKTAGCNRLVSLIMLLVQKTGTTKFFPSADALLQGQKRSPYLLLMDCHMCMCAIFGWIFSFIVKIYYILYHSQ